MPVVGIRELSRDVSGLVERVENGELVLIKKHGRYVAAMVRIDPEGIEDFLLGHLPEFIESYREAEEDIAAGRTYSLNEIRAEFEAESQSRARSHADRPRAKRRSPRP
jgi:antitoxin (DNA-binding transcriptional repressor) of toxin-antitoxin stability system